MVTGDLAACMNAKAWFQLLLVSFLPLVSSCAVTVKEFRENPLMVFSKVSGRHETVANCIMHRLEETVDTWPDMFRLTTEGARTSLLISRLQLAGPFLFKLSPLAEMVFTETRPKDLLVEARYRTSVDGEYYLEQAKPLIASCGKQSLSNNTSASFRTH